MRKAMLLALSIMCALSVSAQDVRAFVTRHIERYPQSRLLDIYKSCFQDFMGAEHLVADTASVSVYLDEELSSVSDVDTISGYYEPCGVNGNYYRVSLRAVKDGFVPVEMLLDAFIRSANAKSRPAVEEWCARWEEVVAVIDKMGLDMSHYDDDKRFIDSVLSQGKYAISHSPDYRNAYHPHYRIVAREIFEHEILPLLPK